MAVETQYHLHDGRSITGEQVNEVQRFLAELVREESLPLKILMVHQLFFIQDTPVMSPKAVQALEHPPDIVIYQSSTSSVQAGPDGGCRSGA